MKRMVQAVGLGVVIGLAAVMVHEVIKSEEFQEAVQDGVASVKNLMKHQKEWKSEHEMLREAERTNDPKVNQQWVAEQWEAVLGPTE